MEENKKLYNLHERLLLFGERMPEIADKHVSRWQEKLTSFSDLEIGIYFAIGMLYFGF